MEIGEKVSKDDFFIGNLLSQGAYGRVFKVKRLKTNQICAIKIVDLGSSQDKTKTSENDVQIEIVINILLGEHPKIARFYGSFGDQKKTYLVFECLKPLICMDFTIDDVKNLARDCLEAVEYAHSKGICHRDIKPRNVLLSNDKKTFKLIDWGLGCVFKGKLEETFCGTVAYYAPEVVLEEKHDPREIDIWCIGILIYEYRHGETPFYAQTPKEIEHNIVNNELKFHEDIESDCRDFISLLLQKDPAKRPTATEALKHPYLN